MHSMRLAHACAASVICVVVGCGPGSGGDDDTTMNITALAVAPATATLESIDHAEVFQDFTVRATYEDGSIEDVTGLVAWNVQPQFGAMQGARFVTTGQVGGVATVTATLDSALGTAEVTINIRTTRVDPSAPPNAPDLFGSGTIDPARAPSVIYPPDQVVVPANLGDFDVHWADASNNDVWEISLRSAHSDIRVYVGASFPRWYAFDATEWLAASGNADTVTAMVRGVSTAVPGQIGVSAGVTATLPDQPIGGGLYYWAAASAAGAPEGIYRHDLSRPGEPAERFYTVAEEPAGRCVACHILSRDGTRMAITYDGGNEEGTLMDVATRTPIAPEPGNWNYGTFTADGTRLITAFQGYLDIRDSATGAVVGQVPTGAWTTQPDFSPTGSMIAYVAAPMTLPSYNVSFSGGSIVVQPYDGANYGAPVTIVPNAGGGQNNYYPSVSPDGAWVVFNRSTGDSYNDPDAELWVASATGAGTPIKLDRANIQSGLVNSWTRWAPFEQTVNGERMFWITFSSMRQFGNRLGAGARPQVWMAGFFPDRAAMGVDPTAPAFWLPFQDIDTNNHIAQWTEQVVPIE
jgi:hypothetical protein